MESFDNQRNSNKGAYLTEKEIRKILNDVLVKNSQSIQDRIINKLAKSAVGIFITIIIASFATFGALTYFISTTKENIELKSQVEKLKLDLHHLQHVNEGRQGK